MRYVPIVVAAALGAFTSVALAAPMTAPADQGLLGKSNRIEMTDQQLDTLKAGAPNCNHVTNNPNCVDVNRGGQPKGCQNNQTCEPKFKP